MAANYCCPCNAFWAATETYRSAFGNGQRPINETCPACGTRTSYSHEPPSDPDVHAAAYAAAAARRHYDAAEAAFEAYYAEQAARELLEELEAWPTHAPA